MPAPVLAALPREQEYKNVTVLACTLTEAPARAIELGDEVMYELMQTLFTHAQEVVLQYAGTITQWSSDGFMALFGAPVAYEDHAWRAVLAACILRERLGQPLTVPGRPQALVVAIGLHTGPVVVGPLAHARQHLYTATGATMYLASQLQQLAGPGGLLLSDVTYEHVRPMVQVQPHRTLTLPAGGGATAVYALHGLTPQHGEFSRRSGRQLSHFVGRAQELALLQERLAQALEGKGQVVGLVGEPGIGKSRLLYELQQQLRGQVMLSYTGRCLSYASAMPYRLGLAYGDVGLSAIHLGAFVTALEAFARTRSLGEAHEDRRLLHMAELHIGLIHTLRGEWNPGLDAYQRVLGGRPDPVVAMVAQMHLGHAYLEQGQCDRAMPLLTQVVHNAQQAQLRGPHSRAAALLAQALLLNKHLEPALHMAQQALHIGQDISYPYCMALAQRVLGRIAQAQDDNVVAEQHLHAALDTFHSLAMRYEQARTHLLMAHLAHQQGHRETLSTHLVAARHLFQALDVPYYVVWTESLAHTCGMALS